MERLFYVASILETGYVDWIDRMTAKEIDALDQYTPQDFDGAGWYYASDIVRGLDNIIDETRRRGNKYKYTKYELAQLANRYGACFL